MMNPLPLLSRHQQIFSRPMALSLGLAALSLFLIGMGGWGFVQAHQQTFYPGIYVDGVNLTDLTKDQALTLVTQKHPPTNFELTVTVDDISVASSSTQLGLHRDIQTKLDQVFSLGRTGTYFNRVSTIAKLLMSPQKLTTKPSFNPIAVTQLTQALAEKTDTPNQEPTAVLQYSNTPTSLTVSKGKRGRAVMIEETNQAIANSLITQQAYIAAVVASTSAELTEEQATQALERAKQFVGHQAEFVAPDTTLKLNDQELVKLLAFPTGVSSAKVSTLLTKWQSRIERPAQDAEFTYHPETLQVISFKPHREGLTIDLDATRRSLTELITEIETASPGAKPTPHQKQLRVATSQPQVTLKSTNSLGITERIGFGDSEYAHSIPSRIHNVAHAAKKINNYIIKPDEEFSFNKALGDVSRASGYQPAYVIKSGQTVLGDGGGVCQVSTTLFRSVLNAGLPVTKRKAHSYRVSYYELDRKPGVDATVYAGDVDLRFKNDTGHHLLIHTETDSTNLYMKVELYGTSDGRTAEIVDHKTWDFRAPPSSQYIPTDTLPHGRVKQIDWSASGIKSSFKNVVKDKTGKVIREEEYYSNYVPWSAKYLRGI